MHLGADHRTDGQDGELMGQPKRALGELGKVTCITIEPSGLIVARARVYDGSGKETVQAVAAQLRMKPWSRCRRRQMSRWGEFWRRRTQVPDHL